jgi:hypothetical protein
LAHPKQRNAPRLHPRDGLNTCSVTASGESLFATRVAFESNLDVKPDLSSFCLAGDDHLNERIPPPLFSALRERWVEAEVAKHLRLSGWEQGQPNPPATGDQFPGSGGETKVRLTAPSKRGG